MTKHSTTAHSGPDATMASSSHTSSASSSAPTFQQLIRTPLIPEAVLKRHGAYSAIDTRYRTAQRLQQALWLKGQNIATAAEALAETDSHLGSILTLDAARAGKNFLSNDIHRLAVQQWMFCEDDAAIDPERLFTNALSSMPLTMNLLGELALNVELASAVFQILFPDFVQSVHRVLFEHSPGRRDERYLADRTAFDFAVHIITPDGEPGIIYGEIKLSESLTGPAARMRERYDEASRQVRLYRDPESVALRTVALEQLWREHMLAMLAVENGVTPRALFMAVAPQLNRHAQVAFKTYEAELLDADQREPDRVAFLPLTLETFIQAIAQAGAYDLARALWDRYCDLGPVFRLATQEYAGDDAPSFSYLPKARLPSTTPPSPPGTDRHTKPATRRGKANSVPVADGETRPADVSDQAVAS